MRIALAGIAILALAGQASADLIVGDYTADYQAVTPASGWAYLWNNSGPIGNLAELHAAAVGRPA